MNYHSQHPPFGGYYSSRDGDGTPIRAKRASENPSPVRGVLVTPSALEKARAYAEAAYDLHGTECAFFLLAEKDAKHRTVTDILFARDQEATSAFVEIKAEDVVAAAREADGRGMKMLGWGHSHASFSPFHSGIDVRTTHLVMGDLAHQNIMQATTLAGLTLEGGAAVHGPTGLKVTAPEGITLPEGLQVELPRVIYGWAYSLVVNAKRAHPDTRIGLRTFCTSCGATHDEQYHTPLVLVRGLPWISFNRDEIKKDVKERMRNRRFFGGGGFWDGLFGTTEVTSAQADEEPKTEKKDDEKPEPKGGTKAEVVRKGKYVIITPKDDTPISYDPIRDAFPGSGGDDPPPGGNT